MPPLAITGPLTLEECIELALRHNYGLAIRRMELGSALDEMDVAWGAFEPELFAGGGRRFIGGDTRLTDLDVNGYRAGIAAPLPTGGRLELSGEVTRTEIGLRPERYDADTGITLRQPLLRGGGFGIGLLPVRLARIEISQTNAELRRSLLDLARSVEAAWWELVFAHRNRELVGNTLTVSERLLAEAQARVRVGLATDIEVLQASTAVASRREDIITADQRIEDRLDDLMLLLGKLGEAAHGISLPRGLPRIASRTFTSAEALDLIRGLPEYRVQLDAVRQRQLLVDRARNEALPTFDVTVGGGFNGFAGDTGGAFDQGFGKRHPDWQVLGEVRIPLGFRTERARLRQAKSAVEIEELRRADLEQTLHAQLREAERAVAAGIERMKVTDAALRLSEQQFNQVLAKFKEGLSTYREMQLAEEDSEEAQARALAAQLEAIQASVRLARLDGTLLSRYGLSWGEGK